MQDRAVLLFAGVQSSSAGLQTQPTWHLQSVRRLQQPALRCGRASESVPEPRSTRKRRRELLCLDVPAQYARTTGPVLLQQQRTLPPICAHTPDNSRHACKQIQSEQPGKGRQPAFRSRPTNAGKAQGSCSPQNRSNQQAEDIDEPNLAQQRSTVRMSRLPGGKVVNGKPSPGFVSLRSGKRIMCPRCEGSGWLGGGSKGHSCDVCSVQKAGELLEMAAAHFDEEADKSSAAFSGNGSWRPSNVSQETRRKSSATQGGRQKKCSLCGELGHNKATCPQNPDAKPPEAVAEAQREAQREREREKARQRGDKERKRFKGVSWSKANSKWRAQIWNAQKNTVEQKGYYNDELEAARAHDLAVLELRGPDAVTNFPVEDYDFDANAWRRARQQERDRQAEDSVDSSEEEDEDEQQHEEAVIPQRMAVPSVFPLPSDQATAQALAAAAIHKAHSAGIRKQAVEFYLPEGDEGWPGGARQQFAAAQSLLEGTIRDVKRKPLLQGSMNAQWLDEMERIGMWQNEAMAAVVFPSAETLPELRRLDAEQQRLLLIFNPQWQTTGQLVSDFGFGRSARDAEAFLDSFEDVYVMRRLRIDGDNVILFKCFPGRWQVHFQWQNGKGDLLVARKDKRPTYAQLVDILRKVPGSRVGRLPSWVDKVRPFFLGMGSGDSVLLPQADTNEPRDEDLAFFEREPQTGDVINTEGGAQILGGQSIDISRSNGNKPRRGKLSERAGMQRHEVESTSEPASGQVLETEVLEPVSRGGGSGRGRRAQQLKERDATQRSEQDENDMELLTTQQAARKAGVSTAELTAMRARQQAIEASAANGRFDQFDIVTGLPVRDLRMEPLAALAAWQARAKNLFGSTDLDQSGPADAAATDKQASKRKNGQQ